MRLRKRENVKTTTKNEGGKETERKDPGEREKEKGENKERRNFGAHNWRQSVGWLNRGVEGSESPCTPMEKKVQVRPRLTRLCFTAHPSSLLPSFSLPSSVFFFPFFFSMLLLLSILPPFFPPVAGILLRTLPPWCTRHALLSGNVKTQQSVLMYATYVGRSVGVYAQSSARAFLYIRTWVQAPKGKE